MFVVGNVLCEVVLLCFQSGCFGMRRSIETLPQENGVAKVEGVKRDHFTKTNEDNKSTKYTSTRLVLHFP